VLVLRIAVGMSVEETAAAVGSTPDAVRVTQHRALNQLRAMVLDTDQATGRAPDGQRVAAGGGAGEQEQGAVAACGEDQGRHCGSD
jgi:RNA polymerase sigma-70 factor, ECF subfamily